MFNKMALGLVYRNGRVVNHRSLLKIMVNPWLRLLGREIGSVVVEEKVKNLVWKKCEKQKLQFDFNFKGDYDFVLPHRRIL